LRYLFGLIIILSTSACSLYQSDGRKFLEKQALQFSAAAANLQGCVQEKLSADWIKIYTDNDADVYSSDNQEFALRIVPRHTKAAFYCTFHFSSVQEMVERTDAAIDLTLEQMVLGLGEFAFHPISPLK